VNLKVLEPATSYSPGSLRGFQQEIDKALNSLAGSELSGELVMTFCFEQFPNGLDWPEQMANPCSTMVHRVAVY
jgi:hypothetical protein